MCNIDDNLSTVYTNLLWTIHIQYQINATRLQAYDGMKSYIDGLYHVTNIWPGPVPEKPSIIHTYGQADGRRKALMPGIEPFYFTPLALAFVFMYGYRYL